MMGCFMDNPFLNRQQQVRSNTKSVRINQDELRFGALTIIRVNTVPDMGFGRNGDVIIVDNTDEPIPRGILSKEDIEPFGVGLWIKVPFAYTNAPVGTVVIGVPGGISEIGDVININGIDVPLTAPNTAAQAVTDINAAAIPNVFASLAGNALQIVENIGGILNISDSIGTPSQTLYVYSQIPVININTQGVWIPVIPDTGSGGGGAPTTGTYLTLSSNPSLANERVFTAGDGIGVVDDGPGNNFLVSVDISGTTPIIEALDGTDSFLIYNISNGNIEQVLISDLLSFLDIVPSDEIVQQRNMDISTASLNNIGDVLPVNSIVRKVTVDIQVPYSPGTSIVVGDSGMIDRLMPASGNDPLVINTYETTIIQQYVIPTQIIATISGLPAVGSAKIIIDYITS